MEGKYITARPKRNKDEQNWCKLHKTASHSDSECFTQQRKHNTGQGNTTKIVRDAESAEAKEAICVEETNSTYSYSDYDDQELKVITSMLSAQPKSTPQMRLRIRISRDQANKTYLALLGTGCCTSFINGHLLHVNKQLGQKLTTSSASFHQVDGVV